MPKVLGAVLLLLASANARAQTNRSFVQLFDAQRGDKSALEQEPVDVSGACKKDERDAATRLLAARKSLEELNQAPAGNFAKPVEERDGLHRDIAAAEESLRDTRLECDQAIPLRNAIAHAKARIGERWPQRRDAIIQSFERDRTAQRKHGDVMDIGYREIGGGREAQEKDIDAGIQTLHQLEAAGLAGRESQDIAVLRRAETVAQRLARNSDLKIPLRVVVVDSDEIRAVGISGGLLLISEGLVRNCRTDSELAGVLSREIAHIAARHSAAGAKQSRIARIAAPVAQIVAGIFTAGAGNAAAHYGIQGLGAILERSSTNFSGAAQKEADQLGIQYAWKAGFDPIGYIAFLDAVAESHDLPRAERWITRASLDVRILDAFTEMEYLSLIEK